MARTSIAWSSPTGQPTHPYRARTASAVPEPPLVPLAAIRGYGHLVVIVRWTYWGEAGSNACTRVRHARGSRRPGAPATGCRTDDSRENAGHVTSPEAPPHLTPTHRASRILARALLSDGALVAPVGDAIDVAPHEGRRPSSNRLPRLPRPVRTVDVSTRHGSTQVARDRAAERVRVDRQHIPGPLVVGLAVAGVGEILLQEERVARRQARGRGGYRRRMPGGGGGGGAGAGGTGATGGTTGEGRAIGGEKAGPLPPEGGKTAGRPAPRPWFMAPSAPVIASVLARRSAAIWASRASAWKLSPAVMLSADLLLGLHARSRPFCGLGGVAYALGLPRSHARLKTHVPWQRRPLRQPQEAACR